MSEIPSSDIRAIKLNSKDTWILLKLIDNYKGKKS